MTFIKIWAILVATGIATSLHASWQTIPFVELRNLIIFHGTVAGQTGNFVLDSGISDIVLNSRYFEGIIDFDEDCQGFQSINGASNSCGGDYVQLHLGRRHSQRPTMHSQRSTEHSQGRTGFSVRSFAVGIDLSPMERQKRMNILGMVGLRAFKKYELTIDYFSREIQLSEMEKHGDPAPADDLPEPTEILPFRYLEHIVYITARIDGKELKLGLDTGVETNMLSPEVFETIKDRMGMINYRSVIGLNGLKVETPAGWVEHLQVGKTIIPAMETIFLSTDELNKLSGPDLDGLLGQEFLRHFRTTFNFKKKEIYLWNEEAVQLAREDPDKY